METDFQKMCEGDEELIKNLDVRAKRKGIKITHHEAEKVS